MLLSSVGGCQLGELEVRVTGVVARIQVAVPREERACAADGGHGHAARDAVVDDGQHGVV